MSMLCVLGIGSLLLGCEEDLEEVANSNAGESDLERLGKCEPGQVKSCGQDNCYGTITCPEDGRWPGMEACVYPAEICDGFDQDCDGVADEDFSGLGESCSSNEEACGINGVNVCSADKMSVVCAVDENTENKGPELCNEIDDDCDGEVDETFTLGEDCISGVGACGVAGVSVCNEDGTLGCSAEENPDATSDEVCDGIDNDCDGTVDEEFDPSNVPSEICDGIDNDCDGRVDEDIDPDSVDEESCDGEDNDCDGRVDEDFTVGEVCYIGEGVCASEGVFECTRSGRGVVCIGSASGDGTEETCNDIDDDCDGLVDEDFSAGEVCYAGSGACQGEGVYVCNEDQAGSTCTAVPNPNGAGEEICDGIDNDCDGTLDENRSFMVDTYDSARMITRKEYKTLEDGQVVYHAIDRDPETNDTEASYDETFTSYLNDQGQIDYTNWDNNGDGRADFRWNMIYENGLLSFRETTAVRETTVLERWFYIYNQQQQLVRIDQDLDADGDIEFEVSYVYNEQGLLTSKETHDVLNALTAVETYEYDENQMLVSTLHAHPNTDDLLTQYAYNEQGWVSMTESFENDVRVASSSYQYMCSHIPVVSANELTGTWGSGCEGYPDGNGGMNYLDRQFTFMDNEWKLFGTVYGDSSCSQPQFSFNIHGEYTLLDAHASIDRALNANFTFTENLWTVYDEGFAAFLNDSDLNPSACGTEEWQVGVPQSVNETGCLGIAHPVSECPDGELDLVRFNNGMLYLGDRSSNLCENRASALGTYGLKPVMDVLNINQDNFYPEGIVMNNYGPVYVGAVGLFSSAFGEADTEGRIVSIPTNGGALTEAVAASPDDEAAVGMDLSGDTLWYCSLLFGQGESSLVAYDLTLQAEMARYPLGAGSFCNDVIADDAGNVYVADSFGKVFKYTADTDTLDLWSDDDSLAPLPEDEGGFIGANGIVLSHDRGAVVVGTSDTSFLVEIAINLDGSAGDVTTHELPDHIPGGGIDGMFTWRGSYYLVRSFGVERVIEDSAGWTVETIVPAGEIDSPTTLAIDNFGNMWIVASQFQYLFDPDPETTGSAPFQVIRKSLY